MITLYNTYKYTNEVGSPVAQRVHNNMEACGISDGTWGSTKLGNLGPRRIKKHIVQAGHIKAWTLCIYQFNHNFMLQDIHESEHMATTLRYVEIPI
jgi:hypothetical protein